MYVCVCGLEQLPSIPMHVVSCGVLVLDRFAPQVTMNPGEK